MTSYPSQPQPRPKRQRWLAGTIAGVAVAAVTAFGVAIATGAGNDVWSRVKGVFGFHDAPSTTPPDQPTPESPEQHAAARIAECERTHHLLRQSELAKNSQGYIQRSCDWPPPSYADADGYTEINVTAVPIPAGSKVESHVDRIVGPCATFRMSYEQPDQGGGRHLPPFEVRPGNIVGITGNAYVDRPQDHDGATLAMRLGFTPGTNEVQVIRSIGGIIESLSCVN
jgi:hypothetical protein